MKIETTVDDVTRRLTQSIQKELETKIREELAAVSDTIVREAPIDVQSPADLHAAITRKYIRESPYWPRIRAALLAGEEMAKIAPAVPAAPALWMAAARFRAATEGTK